MPIVVTAQARVLVSRTTPKTPIFIHPPSHEVLEQRLRSRGSDDEASLKKRLDKAIHEMDHATRFDHTVVNDKLERALEEAEKIVKDFLAS